MIDGRELKHPRLESLWQSIHGVVGEFVVDGVARLEQPITFEHEALKRVRFELVGPDTTVLRRREKNIKALAKVCREAPFGQRGETLVDRRVRDALQLRAGDGGFAITGFDPARSGVLDAIQAKLAPNDPSPIRAEFYGFNLYRPGGHFASHKDTPRGDHMLGTLVVLLPSQFRGGELVVQHHGVVREFFNGPSSYDWYKVDHDLLPWVAFFGDVDHRIEEVYSGDRATLTWTLHRDPKAPAREALSGSVRERLARALNEAVHDESFFGEGAKLGALCVHRYAHGVDAPLTARPLDATTALALEGRDQLVALAAIDAGVSVVLQPIVAETSAELVWPLTKFLVSKEEAMFRKARLKGSEIGARLGAKLADQDPYAEDKWLDDLVDEWIAPTTKMTATGVAGETPSWTLLGEPEFSATGYFGNEGGPTAFYAAAMLVITMPPYNDRARP